MKNARWPEISIVLQFWGEILASLCFEDCIQTLLFFEAVVSVVITLPWKLGKHENCITFHNLGEV